MRSVGLMRIRDGGIQVGLGSGDLLLEGLHNRLLRFQIALCLNSVLIGNNSLIGELDGAAAVTLNPRQGGFGLDELCPGRF